MPWSAVATLRIVEVVLFPTKLHYDNERRPTYSDRLRLVNCYSILAVSYFTKKELDLILTAVVRLLNLNKY